MRRYRASIGSWPPFPPAFSTLLHPPEAEHEMIDEHCPIPQGEPGEAMPGERPLLMGREHPHRRPGEADLEREKERLAVGKGEVHQGIGLTPAVLQVEQREERIQDGAPIDESRARHDTPRETIDIRMVALACPPKACAPPRGADRMPERRRVGTAVSHVALFACLFGSCGCHGYRDLPDVIPVRRP